MSLWKALWEQSYVAQTRKNQWRRPHKVIFIRGTNGSGTSHISLWFLHWHQNRAEQKAAPFKCHFCLLSNSPVSSGSISPWKSSSKKEEQFKAIKTFFLGLEDSRRKEWKLRKKRRNGSWDHLQKLAEGNESSCNLLHIAYVNDTLNARFVVEKKKGKKKQEKSFNSSTHFSTFRHDLWHATFFSTPPFRPGSHHINYSAI